MICSKCKKAKSKIAFCFDRKSKRGRSYRCKECDKLYRKETLKGRRPYHEKYYQQNKLRLSIWANEYYKNNIERIKEYSKKYHKTTYHKRRPHIKLYRKRHNLKNRKEILAYSREYYKNHAVERNEYCRQWRKRNKKLQVALNRKYEALKRQRLPKWLTEKQLQQIKDFYVDCPEGMTVDHIYPLQGRYVSGLHHPDNLQYLTKSANSKKYNNCPEIDDLWLEEMENVEKKKENNDD